MLEALSKPPYEPLREASFKHLTLKTVFLLAMASAGITYCSNQKGLVSHYTLAQLAVSIKNQKPNQVNDPWSIPVVPTGKFGAPNCPVRALRYYHRHLTKHPELRKDRRHLFYQSRTITPVRGLVHRSFLG